MNKIFLDFMKKQEKERIFLDGYPRTMEQVIFMEKNGILVNEIIHLNVPQDVALYRQEQRAKETTIASGKVRPGDVSKEAGLKRIADYFKHTLPLLYYFHKKPILKISGGRLEKKGEKEKFYNFLQTYL